MSSPSSLVMHAVRAGAGAGKTYHLTHQVMKVAEDYYSQHQKWPHLQVTTFTRKATQELNERLLKLALEEKNHLVDFATSKSHLKVSTIDAVLDRFLKNHGAVIGLTSDFSYMTMAESKNISKKIVKSIFEELPEHRQLLSYFPVYQVLNFLEQGLYKDLINFRRLQVSDLELLLKHELHRVQKNIFSLVEKIQSADISDRWQETESILSRIALLLKLEEWTPDVLTVILNQFLMTGLKSKKEPASLELYEELKDVMSDLDDLCRPMYNPQIYQFHIDINNLFFDLLNEYEQRIFKYQMQINKIQIADLTKFSLKIIREHSQEAQRFSQGIDYWLIDEFQDTSPVQIEILNALIGDKSFYFVGDPQQSIYLFRGARSSVFMDRIQAVKERQGKVEFLEKNYRSEAPLLAFINDVSKQMGDNFAPMLPAEPIVEHQNPVAVMSVISAEDDVDISINMESNSIISHLLQLKQDNVDLSRVAILVKKNDQLEQLSSLLNRTGLPHLIHSTGSYWERREVQDAIALLKCLVNPYDNHSLMILLRSPYLCLSEDQIIQIASQAQGFLWRAFAKAVSQGKVSEVAQRFYEQYQLKSELGISVCFEKCLFSLGYFDTHLKSDESGRVESNLWKFIYLLKNFEKKRGAHFIQFLNDCKKSAELEKSKDLPSAQESQRINLMTIHASKGLQFDYVFLPFLHEVPHKKNHLDFIIDEKNFTASIRTPISQENLQTYSSLIEKQVLSDLHAKESEESVRVFYVAMTRAKKALYLSWNEKMGALAPAQFLKTFAQAPGVHSNPNYSILVEHIHQELDCPTQISKSALSVPLRQPYRETRDSLVTLQSLSQESEKPSFIEAKNYKNSFVNKRRGILFHKIMESLKYKSSLNMVDLIERWFPGEEDEMAAAINYIVQLQKPPLTQVIKQGHVEWSFSMKESVSAGFIEGQIDLWGIVDDQLWIIDYKSGSHVFKQKALKQLYIYAQAVRNYLNWDKPIHIAIVYPFLKETFIETISN